jgi:hypothetical protein
MPKRIKMERIWQEKSCHFFGGRGRAIDKVVAQASKPAVSPISKSAGGRKLLAPRRLETCDTADLEICATILSMAVAEAGVPGAVSE